MKSVHISLWMVWVACYAHLTPYAQEFKEHINKEFSVTSAHPVLAVYNVSGSVKVIGYSGNKIVMDIDKTISAKNNEILETGKKNSAWNFIRPVTRWGPILLNRMTPALTGREMITGMTGESGTITISSLPSRSPTI